MNASAATAICARFITNPSRSRALPPPPAALGAPPAPPAGADQGAHRADDQIAVAGVDREPAAGQPDHKAEDRQCYVHLFTSYFSTPRTPKMIRGILNAMQAIIIATAMAIASSDRD